MDPISFTYCEILRESSILPQSASISEICNEIYKRPGRYEKKLKDYLTTSLSEYGPVSRSNCQKVINISKKCLNAAQKSVKENIQFEDKKVIFVIETVSDDDSDQSDVSMASVSSRSMNTRSGPRERGRPRSITPQKRRSGRPRSNSSSTSRDNSNNGGTSEVQSYEIRSRGNSELQEILESMENLKADFHINKKKKFKTWWFLIYLTAAERGVSPRSLLAILELLKELQPILIEMDIPSESLLRQYKLGVPILNELQIKSFMESHDRFTLCFDESPSRYEKVIALGLFSADGNFLCIGVQQCSGKTGESLFKDRFQYKYSPHY